MAKTDKRFRAVLNEGNGFSSSSTILKDTRTGALYLFYQSGYAGGLTPLLGKDGKPAFDAAEGFGYAVDEPGWN